MEFPWRVKQRQADEHLGRLADACAHYLDSAQVGLRYETDPVVGAVRVTLRADAEPPMSLGAIIGDVLHNLRSALDAVAWETCRRAGVPTDMERDVYFPIVAKPDRWESLAGRRLPRVKPKHLEVFRRQQPWYWDEEARAHGVNVVSAANTHPLARLDHLAKVDRHRVPHPVLARAGDTWLGSPAGVQVELAGRPTQHARPGDVVLEWRIEPPGAVSEVHPAGDAILVLSDEAALHKRPALHELQAMQQAVIQATRYVEIEVLEVVTSADIDGLERLRGASETAQQAMRSLSESPHVIDADYIDRFRNALLAEEAARTAYLDRWRELFD
jgi:hypothetical protein